MLSYDRFIGEIVDIRRWFHTTVYCYKVSAQFLATQMDNGDDVSQEVSRAFNETGCNINSLGLV